MKTKTTKQIFIDPSMEQHWFPHDAKDESWIIVDGATFDELGDFIPLDLSGKKIVNGELILKTDEDLAEEKAAEGVLVDAEYKAQRKMAEMSYELTIFPDSTLSTAQKNDIKRVRQEWKDITVQTNYPFEFVAPALDPLLFQ